MAANFTPAPTPYLKPQQGGNAYVPQGTVSLPVSQNALPIATTASGGTAWVGNTYGYNQTPYTVPNTQVKSVDQVNTQLQPAPKPVPTPTPTNNEPSQPSGPSEQDILNSELEKIFNPVFSALSGQEDTLRQNYAPVEGQIQSQANLSMQTLGNEKASGMRELGAQETAAGNRKEDALTSATRLFNELQRGGQQRFGGASSAGEAYQTLTATEQQRRQGTIQSAYETAMQQVGTYKANLEEKFATAQKEVELQKNQAITEAQAQFRDALQSIANARSQAQSDKAAASMNALQDLRNKVYTINQQNLSFLQQLALNKETSLKAVDAYTQKVIASISGGQSAVNSYNPMSAVTTNYGTVQTPTATTQTPTGSVSKYRPEDYASFQ